MSDWKEVLQGGLEEGLLCKCQIGELGNNITPSVQRQALWLYNLLLVVVDLQPLHLMEADLTVCGDTVAIG